ncbi:MAG: hypothetical protein AB1632_12340 [Nitrospirota bacterium]
MSQHIKEADGTSGQDTNTGSGIKTGHIQDGAVTDEKIAGPISRAKIEKYAKVAVVAQSGGDYTNPLIAMQYLDNWCGIPSSSNPCLLKIMPGVYYTWNMIKMKDYVDIEGFGEDLTTIDGTYTSSNLYGEGVISLNNVAGSAEIRSLTVVIDGQGSSRSIGINCSSGAAVTINNVTAKSIGVNSGSNFAIEAAGPCIVNLRNTTAIASDGRQVKAVRSNLGTYLKISNVTAEASNGSDQCVGIYVGSGLAELSDVTSSAVGVTGIAIHGSNSSIFMKNVIADGEGQSVHNDYGTLNIYTSLLNGVFGNGGTAYVAHSQLKKDGIINGGFLKCFGTYDENFDPIICP